MHFFAWAIPVFLEIYSLIHPSAPNHYKLACMMVVRLEQNWMSLQTFEELFQKAHLLKSMS
jgi:hypothetical protein